MEWRVPRTQVILEFRDHILAHKGLEKGVEEHGARAMCCSLEREGNGGGEA